MRFELFQAEEMLGKQNALLCCWLSENDRTTSKRSPGDARGCYKLLCLMLPSALPLYVKLH